jgi:hypothetical protein
MNAEIKEVVDTKRSFNQLVKLSESIESNCSDHLVTQANSSSFYFNPFSSNIQYTTDEKERRVAPLTDYAFSQLCSRLGVPTSYLRKCMSAGKIELVGDNLNDWLFDFNKDLFVREHDGNIRGILTQKYSVLDTPDILDAVGDYLGDFDIRGSYISPERFHLRATLKEEMGIKKEGMFAGIQIDSSDVGRNTLSAKAFFYKLVCTNGLILPVASNLFEQRHIGIKKDEFLEGFKEGLKQLPIVAEEATRRIIASKKMDNLYDLDDLSDRERLTGELIKGVSLSESSAEKVIFLIQNTYDNSRFGLINAITEVAQDYTLERRLELERYAGGLLVA